MCSFVQCARGARGACGRRRRFLVVQAAHTVSARSQLHKHSHAARAQAEHFRRLDTHSLSRLTFYAFR